MKDTTKTLVMWLVAASSLMGLAAYAACSSVYDPMSNQWVYVCSPNPTPQCHNEYDAMNNKWVLVCQ
jgi:hypothetical protein